MNAPKLVIGTALADRSLGWLTEQLGRLVDAPVFAAMGRNRQLRATVTLRCAKVKDAANKSMRSWKLHDTRLLTPVGVR